MLEEVNRYVILCTLCAQANTKLSCTFLSGKLMPLPTIQCSSSHTAPDFVTDFPVSHGQTVILVVIDRFFPLFTLFLISLTEYSGAFKLFFTYFVFCLPEDVVSDRGPQVTSQI